MKPICNSFEEVFAYYKKRSDEIMSGKILKTDSYNEGFGRPIITNQDATLIECNIDHVQKAIEANPNLNVIFGDIRMLFYDKTFDTILDLSTIDHVPDEDIPVVMSNYSKALKPDGKILIIAWLRKSEMPMPENWQSTNQYFLDENVFKNEFKKHFEVKEEKLILDFTSGEGFSNTYLYEMYGVGVSK
jgi:cyclopropane fatty-acyl-phospholipid synthase-like methyltransferase